MNKNEGSALAAEHLLEQTHHHKADTAANADCYFHASTDANRITADANVSARH